MENILYSQHLRRVENAKIIETFDDYDDENERRLLERRRSIGRTTTTIEAKLPEIARRSSGIQEQKNLFIFILIFSTKKFCSIFVTIISTME